MKNGKLFGVLNVVDLAVIAVIAGAAAFAVFYFTRGGIRGGDEVYVYYTIEIEGQLKGFHEIVKEGDDVKDIVRNYDMGSVSKVVAKESKNWQFNQEKREYFLYVYENEELVEVTLKATARETEDKISLSSGGGELRVGKRLFLEGKGYSLVGYVIEVRTEAKQ